MLTIKLAGCLELESRLTVLETVVLPIGRTPYKVRYSQSVRTSVTSCMKQKILQLAAEGKSYREIEGLLGCSKSTIAYHLNPEVKKKYRTRQKKNRRQWLTDIKMESGGKCKICSYDRCLDALDFHHRDPSEKEDGIGKLLGRTGLDNVRLEVKKCVLVCCRCHREIHAGIISI